MHEVRDHRVRLAVDLLFARLVKMVDKLVTPPTSIRLPGA
jgi:hypothetical protein